MADSTQAFLKSLEEEYEKPKLVRNLMPKPASALTVSITLAAGQGSSVNTGPINFTVTFSKAATGFTNADVSFTGSTVGGTLAAAVTGTGPYNVAVTGMTGSGAVQVSIPAAAATDATGVPFPASNSVSVTFDATPLTVTINKAVGQSDPTSTALINFTAVFNKNVTGFTSADVSTTGSTATGTLGATVTGSGTTYNVAIMGTTGAGNVVASIPAGGAADAAGNTNAASTSTDNVVAFDPGGTTGFPDATNTGPLVGTSFTPASGEINTTADGQLIQNLNLNGLIRVKHNNVTIRDCNIDVDGFFFGVDTDGVAHTGLTILRCKVFSGTGSHGEGSCIIFGEISSTTISFCDLSGRENGIFIGGSCNLHDNYIHNLGGSGGDPHIDGIQGSSASDVIIEHNTVISTDTSCIILQNEGGSFGNITINNNRLIGIDPISHGILCQAKDEFPGTCTNVTITNNRVNDIPAFRVFLHDVNGYIYTNNVDDTTGVPFSFDDGGGNIPGGSSATLAYQASATQSGAGPFSIAMTVASAAGNERLIALCGIADGSIAAVTFNSVSIGGQAASQVGGYIRAPDGTGNGAVVSFWRAPGTASTSINVTTTSAGGNLFDMRCSLWTLTNGGTLLASNSEINAGAGPSLGNVDLNVNTAAGGAVAAVFLAYNSTTHTTSSWSGLTQRLNGSTLYTQDWVGAADANIVSASTPLTITAVLPTDFATGSAFGGMSVSFNHT